MKRSELWIARELFEARGLESDLEGHFEMASALELDMLFLPMENLAGSTIDYGYRRFDVVALGEAVERAALPVGVVLDGPFQTLAGRYGLESIFRDWKKSGTTLIKSYKGIAKLTMSLLESCLSHSPALVVVADDLACEYGTYFSPEEIDTHFGGFYARAVEAVHDAGSKVLFHSCGSISGLAPYIATWGFDGLAGCERTSCRAIAEESEAGRGLIFLAGVDADLLEVAELGERELAEFVSDIRLMNQAGDVILTSSSGLYSERGVERIAELHAMVEKACTNEAVNY